MLITTLMFYVMSREVWRWSFARAAIVSGLFLCVDVPFFGANMLKIRAGGWVPLAIAAAIFLLMTTWQRGREILGKRMQERSEEHTSELQSQSNLVCRLLLATKKENTI